jgi:predicted metal-dependent hydrolase
VNHPTLFEDQPASVEGAADSRRRRAGSTKFADDSNETPRFDLFDEPTDVDEISNVNDPDDVDDVDNLDDVDHLDDVDNLDDEAPGEPGAVDNDDTEFEIVVIRSARRKRSVGAHLRGNVLQITVPTWMSKVEEERWIANMSARYRRKQATDRIDLKDRAVTLARRHDLPFPREIRWVDDMTTRWGSCTPSSGTIRMSSRLGKFPDWVIDYVIVHELSHLEHADHSAAFWKVVHRYPKAERAIGYLIAKSGDDEPDD